MTAAAGGGGTICSTTWSATDDPSCPLGMRHGGDVRVHAGDGLRGGQTVEESSPQAEVSCWPGAVAHVDMVPRTFGEPQPLGLVDARAGKGCSVKDLVAFTSLAGNRGVNRSRRSGG